MGTVMFPVGALVQPAHDMPLEMYEHPSWGGFAYPAHNFSVGEVGMVLAVIPAHLGRASSRSPATTWVRLLVGGVVGWLPAYELGDLP